MLGNTLRFCGQPVSASELALIVELVARHGRLSRQELANTVCELLQWRRPNKALKSRECRAFLERLHEREMIKLPALRTGRPRGAPSSVPHSLQGEWREPVHGALADIQPIHIASVHTPAEHRLWRELLGRYHYLGYRVAFGASLRYLITTPLAQTTVLGCLQFSSPAWRMKARDAWIGWDETTRERRLQRIINNSRFLILPWVRVPNLASHVLSRALPKVARDWEARYGIQPWLAETMVDTQRFSGTCYRAANWLDIGLTTGRGRQDRHHRRHGLSPKRIFLYPLQRRAKVLLRQEQRPTNQHQTKI